MATVSNYNDNNKYSYATVCSIEDEMSEWKTYTMSFACKKCKSDYKSSVDYRINDGVELDAEMMNNNMLLKLKADKMKCVKCNGKRFKVL